MTVALATRGLIAPAGTVTGVIFPATAGPSPITDLMQAIVDLWTRQTPPDQTSQSYHHLDDREIASEVILDRGFRFLPQVTRNTPAAETGDRTKALVEWTLALEFFVSRDGRGDYAFAQAIANETSQLARATEINNQWPPGVSEVFVEGTEVTREREHAVVNFTFTALCEDGS